MTSKNPKEQAKAPGAAARSTQANELESRELDKVVGGLKKSSGGPKSGVIDDPCGGDE